MATSDNDLTNKKCWLQLHSNLEEGDETEDRRPRHQCLGRLPPSTSLRPCLGLWRLRVQRRSVSLVGVWQELELSHSDRG